MEILCTYTHRERGGMCVLTGGGGRCMRALQGVGVCMLTGGRCMCAYRGRG